MGLHRHALPDANLLNFGDPPRLSKEYPERIDEMLLRSFFRRLLKPMSYTVSPQRFRYTAVTNLMKSPDHNIKHAQILLGHTRLKSILDYDGVLTRTSLSGTNVLRGAVSDVELDNTNQNVVPWLKVTTINELVWKL